MTSVLNVDTIADKAGTGPVALTKQSAAKAWAVISTSGVIAINGSFNVSGVVDEAAAQTTYSFTNSFSNTNYSALGTSGDNGLIANFPQTGYSAATGSIRGITVTDPSTTADPSSVVNSSMLGDLA